STPAPPEFGVTPPGGGRGRGGSPAPGAPGQPAAAGRQGGPGAPNFFQIRNDFFRTEGALGVLSTSARGHGVYTIRGHRQSDPATTLPAIVIAAEQYGRIARLLAKKIPVAIEADVKNTFYPNPKLFNVVGEIRGTDKADELVMLGAHFDSWHAATGAT